VDVASLRSTIVHSSLHGCMLQLTCIAGWPSGDNWLLDNQYTRYQAPADSKNLAVRTFQRCPPASSRPQISPAPPAAGMAGITFLAEDETLQHNHILFRVFLRQDKPKKTHDMTWSRGKAFEAYHMYQRQQRPRLSKHMPITAQS
jgi:hypothetical protein